MKQLYQYYNHEVAWIQYGWISILVLRGVYAAPLRTSHQRTQLSIEKKRVKILKFEERIEREREREREYTPFIHIV